ncbi:hypothetical protein [Streptomyces glaucosporus]
MAVVVAVAAAVVGSFAYFGDKALSDLDRQEKECCWADGATPEWMSEVIGVEIPASATDRRAGYKIGSRLDTGLLAFTLPSNEAEKYLVALNPGGAVTVENLRPQPKDYKPAAAFAHLGLPEPETIREARRGGFCDGDLDSPEGKEANYCVKLFAHEFKPGSTRIYLRSTIEPAVSPLPTPIVSAGD